MSTVLPPPAAAGLLLELPLLLPLLLQLTAAKAIAAKAAIAVVRLMIFLSLSEVVRLPPSALSDRCGLVAWGSREVVGVPEPLPGRADVAAGTSAAHSPTLAQSRAVRRRSAEVR